jgi:hypothetical protein
MHKSVTGMYVIALVLCNASDTVWRWLGHALWQPNDHTTADAATSIRMLLPAAGVVPRRDTLHARVHLPAPPLDSIPLAAAAAARHPTRSGTDPPGPAVAPCDDDAHTHPASSPLDC